MLRHAKALIETCEAELTLDPKKVRAARLHYEIGQTYDTVLIDAPKALTHYQSSLELVSDYLPAARSARRLLIEAKDYQGALGLFDSEIRVTSNPRRKAILLYEKGRLLEDIMHQPDAARDSYNKAIQLDSSNLVLVEALKQTEIRAKKWTELALAYERAANAVSSHEQHRAAILAQRASLCDTRLSDVKLATELYQTALERDSLADGVIPSLKRLLHSQSRWRELIEVMELEVTRVDEVEIQSSALLQIARIHSDRLGIGHVRYRPSSGPMKYPPTISSFWKSWPSSRNWRTIPRPWSTPCRV